MIGTNVYNYIDVLSKTANASSKRQDVLSNNLANVDTPGYKRQDVSFENVLASALHGAENLDDAIKQIAPACLNASIYTDSSSLSYRKDGNNVDIDTESAFLAKNQMRYYTLLDSISQEFSRIKSVIK